MIKFKPLQLIVVLLNITSVFAQENTHKYSLESETNVLSKDYVPFWFRSNKYGSIPTEGISQSFIGKLDREWGTDSSLFKWNLRFNGRANMGRKTSFNLIEGYGAVKFKQFQFLAGRSNSTMGLNGDSSLTSGNFAISGNALGIPKIEISIPNFYTLPILNRLFAIKGNFAHGWLGDIKVADTIGGNPKSGYLTSQVDEAKTYFHQKSFYIRFGRENWRVKLVGGFNHQVFWGNEKEIYGRDLFELSNLKSFGYIVTGKTYGGKGTKIPSSKIGNQLGSIDLGLDYEQEDYTLHLYRQNFYDVGALAKLANLRDGLNGITFLNKKKSSSNISVETLLLEFLYTKNQAGETWSKRTKSGDEDYYNNYFYPEGWTYFDQSLGNPLLTLKEDARDGQTSVPKDRFINNRVVALHFGCSLNIYSWQLISKLTYSKNFGTFGTSEQGRTTGDERFPPKYGIFKEVKQFSGLFSAKKYFSKQKLDLTISTAFDAGKLLNSNAGLQFKVGKYF